MALYVRNLLLVVLCLIVTGSWAQDVIVKRNGEQVVGRIVNLSADSVHYRYFSDQNGPLLAMSRQDVAHLRLTVPENPEKLAEQTYVDEKTTVVEQAELRLQAKLDANAYYKARGVFWTTMGSTIMHPAAGLVTGAVISAVSPNINSDYNPNRHLLKEPVYRETFLKQARKRKIGKAAAGFGAGAAVISVVYMAVIISIMGG
ncbi:hypothetical protein ACFSRY_09785 [Pontibacter locisalis]|uniref:Uncharacterized protein n=1 Tax=Pontibacter locisalis TaxID=1719035 RepID=A0ABW5IKU7_9BACT